MIWVVVAGAAVCAMMACGLFYGWVAQAAAHYRRVYLEEADVRLAEAFLFIDARQLWIMNLLLCAVAASAVYVFSASMVLGAIAAAATTRVPRGLMATLRRRRQARFDAQLPDMLLALGGSLRAGVGLPSALRQVVQASDPPLAQEFALMLRQQRLGLPFSAALEQLHARVSSEASALVVSALTISAQTGGNLSEALERISATLRTRLQLQGRIRALTAQGRLQAWVVGALPAVLLMVLHRLDPEAMSLLWRTTAGWAALGAVLVLEAAGIAWIRRIVDIDV
jgi:tight adherence protein B